MFHSFCYTYGTLMSPTSKGFGFLQNNAIVSFSLRYFSTNEESFTVSYLIKSCGFSPESALSVSRKVQFKTPKKPDSVISFLKNHEFSQNQIRKLIGRSPTLLLSNPDKNLLPKFEFFYSKGIARCEVARVLSSNPHVLKSSLGRIILNFNSFKQLAQCSNDEVFLTYKKCSGVLSVHYPSLVAPNIAILLEIGVPKLYIMADILYHPRVFARNHDEFRSAVQEAKRLGFKTSKQKFLVVLQALTQISKLTWDRKSDLCKKWGWSDEEMVTAFEKYPRLMLLSEHKISATLDYFVNTMGWTSSYMASHAFFLKYSLEKRIIPRCSFAQFLLSKGLIEKLCVSLILHCTEKDFIRKFVTPHEDPYLLKLYKEMLGLEN